MVAEFILGVGASLTAAAIDRKLVGTPSFLEKRKISAKLDEVVIAVVEPITTFFEVEGIALADVKRIASYATPAIEWLTDNPQYALSRGLEGEQITKDLLSSVDYSINLEPVSDLPTAFEMLLRALVDLVVRVPPVFVDWEQASYKATFKQLEDIKSSLAAIYSMMQEITSSQTIAIGAFQKIVNHRAASLALKMNIHGLRQSTVPQAEIDNLFVFPEFTEYVVEDINDDVSEEPKVTEWTFGTFDEFLDIVTNSAQSVIQAPAGAGKTTFSNWLTAKLLTHSTPLFPVVLPLRKTLKGNNLPSLTECMSQEISKVFLDLADTREMVSWADSGSVVAIFEGFDEVSEKDRDEVIGWIKDLKAAHPNLNTLITSRPLSTSHLIDLLNLEWRDVRLEPFDTKRVTKYIANFQKHGPEIQTGARLQDPEVLASTWRSDPTLGPLTGNPLLLSTLLVVHHMDGELPDDRSKLYERYIDGMLGLWELNKELAAPSLPLTKEQKKKILELIAVNMISQETDAASEEDVAEWIASYLKDQSLSDNVRGILDHLRERSGLLIGPGQYTFAHKSIGEFLVAQACSDGIQVDNSGTTFNRQLLLEKCDTDRWMTVIFLWAGLASKADTQVFIDELVASKYHALAGGLLFERRKFLDRKWSKETLWKWVKTGLGEDGQLCDNVDRVFRHPPGCLTRLNGDRERLAIHIITTLNGGFTSLDDLLFVFFDENICNPSEWAEHSLSFTESTWLTFAQFVFPSEDFINSAPKTLPSAARCYWLIEQRATGSAYAWRNSSAGRQYETFEFGSQNIPSLEVLVLLSYFVSIDESLKMGVHRRHRSGTGELKTRRNLDDDLSIENQEHLWVVEHAEEMYSLIEQSGFFEHVSDIPLNELPSTFFEYLNDDEFGAHRFRPNNDESPEGESLVVALNHALDETQEIEELNPLKALVSAVLIERDRRVKLAADSA